MPELQEIMGPLRNEQRAEALRQIRNGADGTRKVQTWRRLNAYWWLRNGGATTDTTVFEGMVRASTWPTFLRELYGRLHSGDALPPVEPGPEFEYAKTLHSMLDDLPEWERLTQRCRGDSFNAGSATTGLAARMVEHVPQHERDAREARRRHDLLAEEWEERLLADANAPPPPGLANARREMEQAAAEATGLAQAMDAAALRQAMRAAIKEQTQAMDSADRAARVLGWGLGDAGGRAEVFAEDKAAIAKRLTENQKLQDIMEMAGRMRNVMREVQSTKVRHGVNEVTDIELGRDLHRLLPSELVKLSKRQTKLDLFRRLTEGQALQYRLQSEEKIGRGPIVVCIDDSGSMSGTPEVWSKAVALALLELARREKRPFAYCLFCNRVVEEFAELPGAKTHPVDLLALLAAHHGGGTDFDRPLAWALDQIDRYPALEESDVVFVTDGQCGTRDETRRRMARAAARCWGVAIGGVAPSLQEFCDEVFSVESLVPSRENAAEQKAVRGVLSV